MGFSALEARLRAQRPQPGVDLERAIGERVGRRSRPAGRGALAVVLTAGVFGAMASNRGGEFSALEEKLRAGRPQPGVDLERAIGQRVGRSARSRGRALLAVALTAGVFGAMASFGGVGYAVSSVKGAVGPTNGITPSGDQYGPGPCTEYVNPHGKTIPPAGLTPPGTNPKGGENPDGFYLIGSATSGLVTIYDLGTSPPTLIGTFLGGTVIKYTQAPGGTDGYKTIGSSNGQAGAVSVHITGTGDFEIVPQNGPTQTCLVPPPPK